jgi:hypothetical protein
MRAALFLLAFGLASSGSLAFAQNGTGEVVAKLRNIDGVVLIRSGSESIPAVEGQSLQKDQSVLATAGSKAVIAYLDGCDVDVAEEELYKVSGSSPCAVMWLSGPAVAAAACGYAKAEKRDNSRQIAAAGLVAGAALIAAGESGRSDRNDDDGDGGGLPGWYWASAAAAAGLCASVEDAEDVASP